MIRRAILGLVATSLVALSVTGLVRSAAPAPNLSEDVQVERVAATLRCPTCQGLSVADSPSKVAQSMRDIIGEQLAAGRTPDDVRAWFVDRYGEWILLSPSSAGLGGLLWVLPGIVVAAGAVAVLVLLRRRGLTTGGTEDHADARAAVEAHAEGTLDVPTTAAGEQLESALALSEAVRGDQWAGVRDAGAERLALSRVADALEALERERSAAARSATSLTLSAGSPALWKRIPNRVRWAGLVGAFIIVLTGALTAGVTRRVEGGPLTGQPAEVASQPSEDAEITRLREEVRRDPAVPQPRLQLAAALLQAGRPSEAQREAEALLQERPNNLDAVLLSAIAKLQLGDPAGEDMLRTFLDAAPDDHPGRALAEGLLDPDRESQP